MQVVSLQRCQEKKGRAKKSINSALLKSIPLRQRKNIRSLACAIGMPKSTVHKRITEGDLKRHTNAIQPSLTDQNKRCRVQWVLSLLEQMEDLSQC
jgi:hypothetical protein